MPFIKVYLHLVWTTKNREHFLNSKKLRFKVWDHILNNGRLKGYYVDHVGGFSDHCHCLVSLRADQSVQKIVQQLKGESSHWINKHCLTDYKFEWQNDYYAVSVSESILPKVRAYIKNQEHRHKNQKLSEELDKFDYKN